MFVNTILIISSLLEYFGLNKLPLSKRATGLINNSCLRSFDKAFSVYFPETEKIGVLKG